MDENKKLKSDCEDVDARNQDLLEDNNKLQDKLIELQQKLTDEIGVNTPSPDPVFPHPTAEDAERRLSKKKKKEKEEVEAEAMKIKEEMEEQIMLEQKKASNIAAEALME